MKTFECPVCKKNTMLYERSGIYARKTHCGYCKTELNFREIEYRRIKSILFPYPDHTAELEKEIERLEEIVLDSEQDIERYQLRIDNLEKENAELKKGIKEVFIYAEQHRLDGLRDDNEPQFAHFEWIVGKFKEEFPDFIQKILTGKEEK